VTTSSVVFFAVLTEMSGRGHKT